MPAKYAAAFDAPADISPSVNRASECREDDIRFQAVVHRRADRRFAAGIADGEDEGMIGRGIDLAAVGRVEKLDRVQEIPGLRVGRLAVAAGADQDA